MLLLSLKQKILSFLTQFHILILNTPCSMWENSISITYKHHDFFPSSPYYRLSKEIVFVGLNNTLQLPMVKQLC